MSGPPTPAADPSGTAPVRPSGAAPSSRPVSGFASRRLTPGAPYGLGFTLALGLVAVLLVAFAALADAANGAASLGRLDATAHATLYHALGASRELGRAVTWFGNNATVTTAVVVVALALVVGRRVGLAARVVFASGAGGLVIRGLKEVFERARPLEQVAPAEGYSFPSGHAFAATVFYGMMIYLAFRLTDRPWARALAAVAGAALIAAVGLSRVYLNVHYLSDVVGGWLAGSVWLVTSLLLADAVETWWQSRRAVRGDAASAVPRS